MDSKRRIPTELGEAIQDFTAEYGILEGYVIEKDIFIVEAMECILSLQNNDFQLVFCGGTCLSKGYNILERMSEDIDFKIIATVEVSKSETRKKLSHYLKSIESQLIEHFGNNIYRKSMDNNHYTEFKILYDSIFPIVESLRPELKIEFNYTKINSPTEYRKFGTLFDNLLLQHQLSSPSPSKEIEMKCISLSEALVEKMVSFLRRLAMALSKSKKPDISLKDTMLIRHLYDIYCINLKHPEVVNNTSGLSILMIEIIRKDAQDFKSQHPQFSSDPQREMLSALRYASQSAELREQYSQFIRDMVYASTCPEFEEVLEVFSVIFNSINKP